MTLQLSQPIFMRKHFTMSSANSSLRSRLKSYSIIAGSVLSATSAAHAQIIYHTVNASLDVLSGMNHSIGLDLNGDGKNDLDIGYDHHSISNGIVYADFGQSTGTHKWNRNTDFAGEVKASLIGLPNPYSSGVRIGPSNKWFGYENLEAMSAIGYVRPFLAENIGGNGEWDGLTGKFLAVRLASGGHYYYGWVRLSIGSNVSKITIIDAAYQSTPDSAIQTGETTAAVSNVQLQDLKVYSSGKSIFVKYPQAGGGIAINVVDMLGRKIKSIQTTNQISQINLFNSPQGLYTVEVQSGEGTFTEKVYLE